MLFPIFNAPTSTNDIPENDRINFIKKCNKLDNELTTILGNNLSKLGNKEYKILKEKKNYIATIRNIVNDLEFTDKKQFLELYKVLKEIQKDIKEQNKKLEELEKTISTDKNKKDELVNLLVHRMMYDSSKRTLKKPEVFNILDLQDNENDQRKLFPVREESFFKTFFFHQKLFCKFCRH